MLERAYATALIRAIENGASPDDALSGLDRVLERRGHAKLRRRILATFSRLFARHAARERATVLLAHEADRKRYRKEIEAKLGGMPYEVRIDESLIGGYALVTETTRTDQSYKRALLNLYRTITTSH